MAATGLGAVALLTISACSTSAPTATPLAPSTSSPTARSEDSAANDTAPVEIDWTTADLDIPYRISASVLMNLEITDPDEQIDADCPATALPAKGRRYVVIEVVVERLEDVKRPSPMPTVALGKWNRGETIERGFELLGVGDDGRDNTEEWYREADGKPPKTACWPKDFDVPAGTMSSNASSSSKIQGNLAADESMVSSVYVVTLFGPKADAFASAPSKAEGLGLMIYDGDGSDEDGPTEFVELVRFDE